ncbi:hypothetical protein [Nocardia vulneris]|uniref:Type VII secretion protein EccE n=1 Tax=Nocardia vulneris TaxID=1141657 RepID=A0ABR4ZCK6_9NOCA|nr:hypothetical protein [Nocardia vulneris]KIA63060.1 hypothetical protein FG87_22165 [Nocardia vulneris]
MIMQLGRNLDAFVQGLSAGVWRLINLGWRWLVIAAVVFVLARLVLGWLVGWYRCREAREAVWLQVTVPATMGRDAGERFARSLAGMLHRTHRRPWRARHVACEFFATDDATTVGLWVPPAFAPKDVLAAILGAWPGAQVEQVTPPPTLEGRGGVCGREIAPRAGEWSPLVDATARRVVDADDYDPLGQVLTALAERGPGETAVVQVIVAAQRGTGSRGLGVRVLDGTGGLCLWLLRELLDFLQPGPAPARTGYRARSTQDPDPVAAQWFRDVVVKKTDRQHLRVTVRAGVAGSVPARYRRGAVTRLTDGYDQVVTAGDGLITRRVARAARRIAARRPGPGFVATVAELAALWHLPAHGGTYGMDTSPARTRAAGRRAPRIPDWKDDQQ